MSWENDPKRTDPKPLSEALDRLVKSFGAPSVSALDGIFGNWEAVVGPDVASHSRPVKLEGNQLTVAVDDGAWASQLRWMTNDVIDALNRAVGEGTVTRLTVRVARGSK